jgi:hypothetical protein
MRKVWKWIIGIVLGLVVIAVLMGVGFTMFGLHAYRSEARLAPGFSQRGFGMMPYGGFEHMRAPGMMGRGWSPLGGFFGGLVGLGFLVLVVLGIIWLVRSLLRPTAAASVPMAVASTPAAVSEPTPETMPGAVVNPCKRCGKPLQDDWKVCPHCGKKV